MANGASLSLLTENMCFPYSLGLISFRPKNRGKSYVLAVIVESVTDPIDPSVRTTNERRILGLIAVHGRTLVLKINNQLHSFHKG